MHVGRLLLAGLAWSREDPSCYTQGRGSCTRPGISPSCASCWGGGLTSACLRPGWEGSWLNPGPEPNRVGPCLFFPESCPKLSETETFQMSGIWHYGTCKVTGQLACFTDTGCRHRLLARQRGFTPQPASAAARCSCQLPRPWAPSGRRGPVEAVPAGGFCHSCGALHRGDPAANLPGFCSVGGLLFHAIKEADLLQLQRHRLCLPRPFAV